MITQELIAETFEYKDGALYWKKPTHPNKDYLIGTLAGSIHKTGYRHITWMNNINKAHRLIFMLHYGYMPKEIDHINGDRADNRLENLREVTRSQNQYNKTPQANTSGVRNVSWHKKSKAWIVRLTMQGKTVFQQYFKDLELAELVAIEARDKFFGKYNRPCGTT